MMERKSLDVKSLLRKPVVAILLAAIVVLSGCEEYESSDNEAGENFKTNIEDLSKIEIAHIAGTYRSEDEAIIVFYSNGSTRYYKDGHVESGLLWRYEDGTVSSTINEEKDIISADYSVLKNGNFKFASSSQEAWDDVEFTKISDQAHGYTDKEMSKLAKGKQLQAGLEGKNVKDVQRELVEAGFSNFKIKKVKAEEYFDGDELELLEEGTVKSVKIGDKEVFFSYKKLDKDSKVVIKYYTKEDNEGDEDE